MKRGDLDTLEMDTGEFFSSTKLEDKKNKRVWEVINVYGPVQHERKAAFLQELNDKICHCDWPFIMGGDFNLIRFAWEMSSKLDQFLWMLLIAL